MAKSTFLGGLAMSKTIPSKTRSMLKPAEVAELMGVDAKTVSRWAKEGRLRAIRTPGGHRRFYRSDIENYLKQADTAYEQATKGNIPTY